MRTSWTERVPEAGFRDWSEDTGWRDARTAVSRPAAPIRSLAPLRRVFARPEEVAEVAACLVRNWRWPAGDFTAEWSAANEARTVIGAFCRKTVGWRGPSYGDGRSLGDSRGGRGRRPAELAYAVKGEFRCGRRTDCRVRRAVQTRVQRKRAVQSAAQSLCSAVACVVESVVGVCALVAGLMVGGLHGAITRACAAACS